MAVLADLERLLERVFERSTARLFRAHPQAVQLERRVERAMERARVHAGSRVGVPAHYRVRLHPDDLAAAADAEGGAEALAGRLADTALAFARVHGYHLPSRPTVSLVADPAVPSGVIEVEAVGPVPRPAAAASPGPRPASPAGHAVPDMPVVTGRGAVAGPPIHVDLPVEADGPPAEPVVAGRPEAAPGMAAAAGSGAAPSIEPDPAVPRASGDGSSAVGGIRAGDASGTVAFRRPAPAPMRALLRVLARDGSERTVQVDGTPLTVGRAADNGLVLADQRVSRHHARLQARRGTLVLTDLGSTNGSRVNGVRVDECALGTGDRIVLGDTVLVVEQLPG